MPLACNGSDLTRWNSRSFFSSKATSCSPEQPQAAGVADRGEPRGDRLDVDGVRLVAFEAEQHGLVAAVALAGGAERSVELGDDARRPRQQAIVRQAQREHARGAHRPDRVRD